MNKLILSISILVYFAFNLFLLKKDGSFTQEYLKTLKPYSRNSKYGAFFATLNKDEKICIQNENNRICGAVIPSKDYSTNGMAAHLKNVHKMKDANIKPSNLLLKENTNNLLKYTVDLASRTDLTFTIARLVCSDLISINTIATSIAFKTLLKRTFNANPTHYLV